MNVIHLYRVVYEGTPAERLWWRSEYSMEWTASAFDTTAECIRKSQKERRQLLSVSNSLEIQVEISIGSIPAWVSDNYVPGKNITYYLLVDQEGKP